MGDEDRMLAYLEQQADALHIRLSDVQRQQFRVYYTLLSEYNAVMNLTAVTGSEETARRHFLDSAGPLLNEETALLFRRPGVCIADIGTGAGFPGVPLAILLPEAKITLADSLQKRTNFLEKVLDAAELSNVEVVNGRAEDLGKLPFMRERFGIVVSRAVAELPVLCEYCMPFVKAGGVFVAWKGPAAQEETEKAKQAIEILGGAYPEIHVYSLPGDDAKRNLVVIQKATETPGKYPRRAGIPAKRPL